jgi:hypothetical protein
MVEPTSLKKGAIISYRLLPAERPTHPLRIWRGRIIACYLCNHFLLDLVRVESLEPGYEELTELVLISQIVKIETMEA